MANHLVVVLGAGASYDCASSRVDPDDRYRPPLTRQLFEPRQVFRDVLLRTALAQVAAPEIRLAVERDDDAFSIEEHLRVTMRGSPRRDIQRQYTAVPYYLRDLLGHVSTEYTQDPDRYSLLLNGIREIDDVLLITLNYDSILEYALRADGVIESMDDYLSRHRGLYLIKLHGSVDWVRAVMNVDAAPQTLETVVDAIVDKRESPGHDIHFVRYNRGNPSFMAGLVGADRFIYPALSVPLGGEDETSNCPESHRTFAREWLREKESINLLTIGYSGLDGAVIDLLEKSGCRLSTACIVLPGTDAGKAATLLKKLNTATGSSLAADLAIRLMEFSRFAESSELKDYIARVAEA